MRGFINIIKPEGITSATAVNAIKRKVKMPCGHMGTLDPMASGVLPVGLGKTTRLFPYLLDKEKTYVARFLFGVSTDTLDITGKVIEKKDVLDLSEERINSVLPFFIGEIEQIPPKFSAKCVDGKRGYQLARNGIDFELAPKKVTVLDIKCNGKTGENEYEFTIKCKGGTYIRSLAKDIASKCGTIATMSKLDRVGCGCFNTDNGVKLEDFVKSKDISGFILPPDIAVNFPKLVLDSEKATKILNGVFNNYGFKDGIYRVYNESEFWGVGESKDGVLKIISYVR